MSGLCHHQWTCCDGMRIVECPVNRAAQSLMQSLTSLSEHLLTKGLRVTGHQPLSDVTTEYLMAILMQAGTAGRERERLKMFMNTPVSWSVHDLRTSGPTALQVFTHLKHFSTSSSDMVYVVTLSMVHADWTRGDVVRGAC